MALLPKPVISIRIACKSKESSCGALNVRGQSYSIRDAQDQPPADKGKLQFYDRNENSMHSKFVKITSIIRQTYKNFNLIVVNDHSSDNTVKEILKVTSKNNFKHFQIIDSKPLPKGWTGKTWAINQGIIEAL